MKHVLLVFSLVLLLPPPALPWGRVGHAAIADLAESRLTPQAAKTVQELLAVEGYKHLSDISSWADQIKSEHLPGSPAHSIRLPLDHSATIVPDACPSGYCVVKGIDDYYKVLADKNAPLAQREVALKYLVHLVGDVHQPLHASRWTGKLPVVFEGKPYDLHEVWDTGIIVSHDRNPERLAQMLSRSIAGSRLDFGGDPASWALESRDIARDRIYVKLPTASKDPVRLPSDYAQTEWPVIQDRLTQAGVRLANLLNSALTPAH